MGEDFLDKILELGLLAKGIIPEEDDYEDHQVYEEPKETKPQKTVEGYLYWRAPSAEYIRDLLETLHVLNDEVFFTADANQIKTQLMDPSHISLIDLTIGSYAFEEYEIEGEKLEFGLDLKRLLKILPKKLKKHSMAFGYPADEESDKAKITIIDPTGSTQEFYIDTLEVLESSTYTPKFAITAKARLNIHTLYQIIRQAEKIGEGEWTTVYVTIAISQDAVKISSKADSVEMTKTIDRYDPSLYELEADSEAHAKFSAERLSKFLAKARKLTDEVLVELSTNKPIRLTLPTQSGELQYLQAPVVDQ